MTEPSVRLNVGRLLLDSMANGPGRRAVVWVQGCRILCPGCINGSLLAQRRRYMVDPRGLCRRIMEKAPHLEGVTLSGGEPFDQAEACTVFLKAARAGGWSTMVYSGYRHEDLRGNEASSRMLDHIDILVDGPFIRAEAADLVWRGSRNQRVLFLTDRYDERMLQQASAREEWILAADKIIRTGIRAPAFGR